MDQPQELEVDEEHEIVERVAAIDVAKASGMVCTRVPHQSTPGKRVTKVFEVRSTANAIAELADHLVEERIERVVLESTSDYWRGFFYVLEGAGLTVWLVNAKQVRNVPGRPKTDLLTELPEVASQVSAWSGSTVPAREQWSWRLARLGHARGFTCGIAGGDGRSLSALPPARCRWHHDRAGVGVLRRARRLWPTGDHAALLCDGPLTLVPLPRRARGHLERGDSFGGQGLLPVAGARPEAGTPPLAPTRF